MVHRELNGASEMDSYYKVHMLPLEKVAPEVLRELLERDAYAVYRANPSLLPMSERTMHQMRFQRALFRL